MAAARKIKPEDAVINGNPLMRAEVDRFVENSRQVSSYQKIAEYMFWGATTILVGLVSV